MFYCCPMLRTWIGLISTHNAHCITNVWPSAKHCVHETSYSRSIRTISQFLSLSSCVLGHICLERWTPCLKGENPFLESCMLNLARSCNIIDLWKSQLPFLSASKQFDSKYIGRFTKIFHCKVTRQPYFYRWHCSHVIANE